MFLQFVYVFVCVLCLVVSLSLCVRVLVVRFPLVRAKCGTKYERLKTQT